MTYHALDAMYYQPSPAAELAERAYRAGQKSVISTVRLTTESVGPALTMANALQHALRTYRAYKAEHDDPELRADLRAKAMRQVELYEGHRAALVEIERQRRTEERCAAIRAGMED